MFNQSTIKLPIILLATVGSLVSALMIPVQANEIEGNIRGMIGHKTLENDDWGSMDQQAEIGVLLDLKMQDWPVSIAVDLFGSGADSDDDDTTRERGYTVEQHVGVRKTWSLIDAKFHPYVGGGVAVVHAGFEQRNSVGGAKDDDSGVGGWLGGGAYWNVTPSINLGMDFRYSEADVTVFNEDIKAGGSQAGFTLGYNW